ncbi:MAG: porin [Pseudomonadota bacterium]
MLIKHLTSAAALFVVFLSHPACAQELSMRDIQAQLRTLTTQVQKLSETVERQDKIIQRQEAALRNKKETLTSFEQSKRQIKDQVALLETDLETSQTQGNFDGIKITKDPTPKFETADGKFSFQPFGRVHLDATFFDNDKSGNKSNTNIRRARFGFKGKIGEDLEYNSEMDFSEDEADIQDMTLTYTGLKSVNLTVGHHRPPVGFERNTSSNHNMMIERAVSTNLFSANRRIGASVATKAENYSLAVGVYNEDAGADDDEGEDFSIDSRLSANLLGLYDEDNEDVFHVGFGHSFQVPDGDVRYRARPGIGDGARFVDTGVIDDVDTINIMNAELVGVFGPLSFQSEYFITALSRESEDARLDGYYGQIGYFLTGETRNYDGASGLFKRTRVLDDFSMKSSGAGAWELLARYDHTNLNDLGSGLSGGKLDLYTVGLNWYLNKNVRLMGNVIMVNSDENAATAANDDPTIFKMRAQWDF